MRAVDADSGNLGRDSADPLPQVELVRSLVDQDAAAFAAPCCTPIAGAIVCIRAVPAVDDPVGTADLAELSALDLFTDLDVQRVCTLIEHDSECQLRMTGCALVHLADVLGGNTGRLLNQSMNAMLQSIHSNFRMEVMRKGRDNRVDQTGGNHFFIVFKYGEIRIQFFDLLSLGRIDICDSCYRAVCRGISLERHTGICLSQEHSDISASLITEADDAETKLFIHCVSSFGNMKICGFFYYSIFRSQNQYSFTAVLIFCA